MDPGKVKAIKDWAIPKNVQEFAAIILELKLWRKFLIGRIFTLKIDRDSLQYIFTQSDLNARKR